MFTHCFWFTINRVYTGLWPHRLVVSLPAQAGTPGYNGLVFYVYLLNSLKNNFYYVGFSEDLRTRVAQHNAGKVKSTRPLRPLKLVYYEAYINRETALLREKELKQRRIAKEEIIKRINAAPSSSG